MSRMIITILILVVTILLFHFGGIIPDGTPAGFVLGQLGLLHPENFGSTGFFLIIIGLTLLGTGGIIIGLFMSKSLDTAVYYGVSILLLPFLASMIFDLILIFEKLKDVSSFLAVMIVSPLIVVWALSLLDWVRGLT